MALGAGSVADAADTVSVGAVGSERRIVNVAAGAISSSSTDAVNGSQFYTLQQQIADGGIGLVLQAGPGQPITVGAATDGTEVDFTGADGARVLTGVGAGALSATSTDAVNGSQLLGVNQRIAMAFGGGAGVDANGQLTAPSYTIQGADYDNVGDALGALDGQVTTNTTNIANLTSTVIGIQSGNSTYVKINSTAAPASASRSPGSRARISSYSAWASSPFIAWLRKKALPSSRSRVRGAWS